jgi:hypothetical protein
VINNAARQGDARGDHTFALRLLDNGLVRHTDASGLDRVRALLYRAELAVRIGDQAMATGSLSEALSIELTSEERTTVADDIAHATELVQGLD